MALTATEEAQVKALIAQNAALLSLASSEPTIISKLAATKVSLADLTAASTVADSDLFLVRQGSTEKSVSRAVFASSITAPDASTTVKGIVELATNSEVQAGTDTMRVVTPSGLAGAAFGIGQTLQNVSSSRVLGTTYSNTSGKTIFVEVSVFLAAGDTLTLRRNGNITQKMGNNTAVSTDVSVSFVILPSETYSVTTSGTPTFTWYETR